MGMQLEAAAAVHDAAAACTSAPDERHRCGFSPAPRRPPHAGAKAEVKVTEAAPSELPPHPSHLPLEQLADRRTGNWRPVKLTVAAGRAGEED